MARLSSRELAVIVGLALMTALIFGAVIGQMLYHIPASDYSLHTGFARDIHDSGKFVTVHVLFQLLILLIAILPVTLETAALILTIAFYVATVLILYALIRTVLRSDTMRVWLIAAGIALALLLVAPVSILTLPRRSLYFGYIGINVPHNPTMVLLKPFALLLFLFAVGILNHQIHLRPRTVIAGVVLVALSMFAKPNFALILLPALLIVGVYRLYRRDTADLIALTVALIIPMIALLGLQYILQYTLIDSDTGGILIAPLLSIMVHDRMYNLIPAKFLLSILFPLIVYVFYRREAQRDFALMLAWLLFIIGAAQMYLLAEGGERLDDGNFWWSAQIGLFILFVISTVFWLRHYHEHPRRRRWWCGGMFLLHLLSGVVLYTVQFQSENMWDWW